MVGIVVTVAACLGCLSLPDLPRKTTRFTKIERQIIISRLAESSGWSNPDSYEKESMSVRTAFHGLWKAIRDGKTWLSAVTCFLISFSVAPFDTTAVYLVLQTSLDTPSFVSFEGLNWVLFSIFVLGTFISQVVGSAFNTAKGCNKWIRSSQLLGFIISAVGLATVLAAQVLGNVDDALPKIVCFVIFVSLGISWFCLPLALAWALSCFPWERNKRAASIAIITTVMSASKIYALLGPKVGFRVEDLEGDFKISAVLMGCYIGTICAVIILYNVLGWANSWMDILHAGASPEILYGSGMLFRRWTLQDEFRGLEHRYHFPT